MVLSSKSLRSAVIAAVLGTAAATSAQAQLTANFYALVGDAGTSGGGLLLASQTGSPLNLNTLMLGDSGPTDWDPLNLNSGGSWGARITGCIAVESSGQYTFNFDHAESLYVYIDGVLKYGYGIQEAGSFLTFGHVGSATFNLTAGLHTIRVDYLNVIGSEDSGYNYLNVDLGRGVSLSEECPVQGVPEVGTMAAAGLGAGLVMLTSKLRKKSK